MQKGGYSVTTRLEASTEINKILDEVEVELTGFLAFQRVRGVPTSVMAGLSGFPTDSQGQISSDQWRVGGLAVRREK